MSHWPCSYTKPQIWRSRSDIVGVLSLLRLPSLPSRYSRDDDGTTSGSRFRDGRGCNICARTGAASSSSSSSPAKRRGPSPGRGGRSGAAWAAAIFRAAVALFSGRRRACYNIFDSNQFLAIFVVGALTRQRDIVIYNNVIYLQL